MKAFTWEWNWVKWPKWPRCYLGHQEEGRSPKLEALGVKKRERLELREKVQVTVTEKTATLRVKVEFIISGAKRKGSQASLEKWVLWVQDTGWGWGMKTQIERVCSCPRSLQRRGYKDLTLHKQTAVSQTGKTRTTLGKSRGCHLSPSQLMRVNTTLPMIPLWSTDRDSAPCPSSLDCHSTYHRHRLGGGVPDYLWIHLLLVSIWSTIHQLDLFAAS